MDYRRGWIVLLVIALAGSAGWGETIVIKGGYQVTGDVLKADKTVVIVDLGCAVLRLPSAKVVRIVKDTDTPTDPTPAKPTEKTAPAWRLYRTAKMETTTIEKNARRFGEGVVMVTTPGGLGSGFVITDDGYCITNYHVIAQETRLKITVFRRSETGYEQKHYKNVKIVAMNPHADLALLKIESKGETFKYVYLGEVKELEAGQDCFAIGNPLGLTRSVSQGIVSVPNRNFAGQLYIQTTTDINPGNSGGPLFNLKGEVIGVTSMGYLFFGGLNFAIPADVVKRFIENRDAFAYDEDNPNSGNRYLQPPRRINKKAPPAGKLPELPALKTNGAARKAGN